MSNLNVTLAYFLSVMGLSAVVGAWLRRKGGRWAYLAQLPASLALASCRLECRLVEELGGWAGGLGPEVILSVLFITLLAHGLCFPVADGNPSSSLQEMLLVRSSTSSTLLSIPLQLGGAYLGLMLSKAYWALELSDMHMLRSLMGDECSSSLKSSLLLGFACEMGTSLTLHLLVLYTLKRHTLIRVPLVAFTHTLLTHAASSYSSGLANPSLAYAVTFYCPGFSFLQYALVYWTAPLSGMALAVFLYMGHIPKLFSRNLLYSQKGRFRIPKKKESGEAREKSS
ncbi:aquaporin-12-like [Engraulis encrasicolus]|uniref:aquaporin-12-like n=1 Tax=Engraulis encrasicolus TaxID=184585 RepID=UPI002FD62A0D